MRAIVCNGERQSPVLIVEDQPDPQPARGEARIRTTLAGICHTDLEVMRGYASFQGVLGHEFVGVVDRAEDPALVGRRVVGEINATCGTCSACAAGRPTHCSRRTVLGIRGRDGVFAEFFSVPASNLHLVPDTMPDRAAVFAEPLAAACQITNQIHVAPTDRVMVLGDGKLGLLVAQVLALTGCELTVVGRHQAKLAILGNRGIATQIGTEGLAGRGDLVVECTGQADGFHAARSLVRPGGTLVLKSTYHGSTETDLSGIVVNEIRIVGSRCGPISAALRLLAQGMVDVESLIEGVYPLDQGLEAFQHAARRGVLKILVQP